MRRKPREYQTKRKDADGLPVVMLDVVSNRYGARSAKVRILDVFDRRSVSELRNLSKWLASAADWLEQATK